MVRPVNGDAETEDAVDIGAISSFFSIFMTSDAPKRQSKLRRGKSKHSTSLKKKRLSEPKEDLQRRKQRCDGPRQPFGTVCTSTLLVISRGSLRVTYDRNL